MVFVFIPATSYASGNTSSLIDATITKIESDTTYNFELELENSPEDCYVYAALYDIKNSLIGIECVPLETEGSTSLSIGKSSYNSFVKIFVWTKGMQPITEVEEFALSTTVTEPPEPTSVPTITPEPPSNIVFSFDETTGILTISGTGYIGDSFSNNENITSVIIENGVTGIGDGNYSRTFTRILRNQTSSP